MKIGDVARELGVSVSTLRFYEQKDLISPGRSEGGTRDYTAEDINRFKAIQAYSTVHVPLEAMANLAAIRRRNKTGDAASKEVAGTLGGIAMAIEARMQELQSVLADIRKTQSRLHACCGCRKRPVRTVCAACDVAPALLDCEVMRIVWDQEPA